MRQTSLIGGQTSIAPKLTFRPLAIAGVPSIATVGTPYNFTPSVIGGKGAKTFALTGSLPAGLSFSTVTGAITGTPTAAGTTSGLSIAVTDTSGSATLSALSLVVAAAAPGPSTASVAVDAAAGTTIETFTGLAAGETVISVSPNDGRVALNSGGTALVTGLSASNTGSIAASFQTSGGRSFSTAITVTGGGASPTILARQSDGTVYVVSLGSVWKPILTRQSDGTVTVGA